MTAPRPTVHLPASSLLVGAAATTSRAALVAGVEDRLDTLREGSRCARPVVGGRTVTREG
jgi:hypothetical protein